VHVSATERRFQREPEAEDPQTRLALADWRRRVSELYGQVRALAALDPHTAWDHWRSTREQLYRDHPSSPVPQPDRRAFLARHFPYDPTLRFEVRLTDAIPNEAPAPSGLAIAPVPGQSPAGLPLPMSSGDALRFQRIGWVELPLSAGPRRLAVFWLPEYSGGLFLPFRDATNGGETYGGGRYLIDSAKGADLGGDAARGTIVVDFNFAYHPSCAFDPAWSCPLSPPENRLDVEIRAGESLR
jgi:uncharacterized protein (DUF1684 family)